MLRLAVAAAALAATVGCQPSWSIHGRVAVAKAGEASLAGDDSLTPLPFARVTLSCPGSKGVATRAVTADRHGFFEFDGAGPGPALECEILAQAGGYAPSATSVDDICADDGEGEGRCVSATLLATLEKLP